MNKAHAKADLKLRLINMYQRGGIGEVQKYLARMDRDCFLKRHRKFKATLEGAEILCRDILIGREVK